MVLIPVCVKAIAYSCEVLVSLQDAVKPEIVGGATGLDPADAEYDSEELSEGEELRRAASAYATSARHARQEVIVLEDSDEEPPIPKRPAHLMNGFQPPSQRQRLLQQPVSLVL